MFVQATTRLKTFMWITTVRSRGGLLHARGWWCSRLDVKQEGGLHGQHHNRPALGEFGQGLNKEIRSSV